MMKYGLNTGLHLKCTSYQQDQP